MARKDELDELFQNKEFLKKLVSIAFNVLRDKDDAKDAVSNAVMDAYEHTPEKLADIGDIKGWFCRVTYYKAIEIAKKRNRNVAMETHVPQVSQAPEKQMDIEIIRTIIKKQHNDLDNAVLNGYLEGYNYKEIGDKVGKAEAYVRKRMFEIRNTIKSNFGMEGELQ